MSIFQDETPCFTDPAEIDDGRTLEPIEENMHYCENTKTILLFPQSACSCEPEPILEQDRRSTGTFAEGQQRLAHALDSLTELAIRREE